MNYIYTVVDENDADYLTRLVPIEDEDIAKIKEIAKNIDNVYHNWPTDRPDEFKALYDGKLTEDDIELLEEYLPSSLEGVHTIMQISIFDIASEDKIISDVKFRR